MPAGLNPLNPDQHYDLPFADGNIRCERVGGIQRFNFPHSIVRHSPTGMAWGYGGSGPADFAINALLAITGDRELATDPEVYQAFKFKFVATLPYEGGMIRRDDVLAWLRHEFGYGDSK